jgi:predicted dehydrogenase
MTTPLSRRQFLGRTAALGAVASGFHLGVSRGADSKSPQEKLNLAIIGTANKGWHNVQQLTDQNIVALCDVDARYLAKAAESFPQARQYRDYRKLLEAEANRIDAVVVSTADHTHAPATSVALDLGKHVYCEKPLTHTVEEARAIAQLAARNKRATQMGTQIHAGSNYRRVVEIVQSGALGKVTEVYNWCNKGWSDGRFVTSDQPAPTYLDWDLWLGPAKQRPYSPNIHPANWRRFWEYGSGTFGDMAAHVMDLPFWALGLRHPTAIEAEGPEVHPDGAPNWCKAVYDFPARGDQPAVKFHWSDGGKHHDLVAATSDHKGKPLSSWGLGVLFVGDKGMLAADYGHYNLLPQEKFADFSPPEKTIPDSIGHWKEWVAACKTGSPTTCNFDYSGALTETILLGIVAFRSGQRLQWDAAQLKATNCPEAERFIRKRYRQGFEVVGIRT